MGEVQVITDFPFFLRPRQRVRWCGMLNNEKRAWRELRPFCVCWCWLGLRCSSLPASFTGFRLAPHPLFFFVMTWGSLWCWLFRCCKRPNGMEVGFSLLSLGLVAAEKTGFTVAPVVARSIGRAPSIPFGGKSHASTRQGTQATVRASSVSRGRAGQTESGTRKGT